ncbi:MAG: DUF1054 domain-containing protein [Lactobacillus sp.]|jgi:uncharacterized protein YktB (UPF0637 family)|nr:DUF1054 domain-containing protein [Lactobacillus sp.]
MIDQQDFDVFKDPTLAGRLALIRSQVDPKFEQIGARYATQFTQQSQFQFYVHIAKHLRRHKNPPPDTWLAIGEGKRGYKMLPHFEIGLWPNALFIWLAYLAEVDEKPAHAAKLMTLPKRYPDLATSGLMLAQDHTQPSSVPFTDANFQRIQARFSKTKAGEFLIGRLVPLDSEIFSDGHKQQQLLDQTMAQLFQLYLVLR